MYFLLWNFVGVLFCVKYDISYARSLSSDNFFKPTDDQDVGNVQFAPLPGLDGDSELQSYDNPTLLSSSNEDLDSSIPLSQDGGFGGFSSNDPASAPLFIDDAAPLTASNDDSALALNDLPLSSLSGGPETPASNNLFQNNGLEPEFISDDTCIPGEEQDISKSKRGDDFCLVTDGGKKSFPPIWANPYRWNYKPENEPKRRPTNQKKNSRPDFINCPSGPGGYRMYLICDSGREEDRTYTPDRGVTLVNLYTDRDCMLLSLPHACAKPADSLIHSWIMRGSTKSLVLSRVLHPNERLTLGNILPRSSIETIVPLAGLKSAKEVMERQFRHWCVPSIAGHPLFCFFASLFISARMSRSQIW